jgi:hypothetical protein
LPGGDYRSKFKEKRLRGSRGKILVEIFYDEK